jgi:predicted AlkP superfamily phosphohydrolase/phosphomutase
MATSRDPGSLGVYGIRNRIDHSYNSSRIINPEAIQADTIWDQIAYHGKRSNLIGVPPSFPPKKINGICVGCFLTSDANAEVYTYPATVKDEITNLVGEYPVDVQDSGAVGKDGLKDEIYASSRKQFEVVRHYLQNSEWDYFQFVEMGLDRLQQAFWKYPDAQQARCEPGHPYENVIRDYYLYLDEELGQIFEILPDDTAVLVVSPQGVQQFDEEFSVNEWLVREGLLVLKDDAKGLTPFNGFNINWDKTKVWSEGGADAQLFFNVKGREPNGIIEEAEYEKARDDLKQRLESIKDENGRPRGARVYKPDQIYKSVGNIAPDLIVNFVGRYQRVSGGAETSAIQMVELRSNDLDPGESGSFILAASNNPLYGQVEDVHILDLAPTLLELGGYDIPETMQGKSLVTGRPLVESERDFSLDEEELIRQRLSGLGYIA